MTYTQYRLAKRNGQLIQQERKLTVTTKRNFKWYEFWRWGYYEITREYTEWVESELPEVE